MRAIILAAGIGKRIRRFTKSPKCLIRIKNTPLVVRCIRLLNNAGIKDVVVVAGYKSGEIIKALRRYRLKAEVIINNDFQRGSILSLWAARNILKGEVLLMDADLYFEAGLIKKIVNSRKDNFFLIDTASGKDKEAVRVGFKKNRAVALDRGLDRNYTVVGEWAGFLRLSPAGANELRRITERKVSLGGIEAGYEFIIPGLFKKLVVSYELIDGLKWTEIDSCKDVSIARKLNIG